MTRYDVIVAGLGAMGSATACHLARRGSKVLALDRFSPPHDQGSSSGRTRIIREAYFEHPSYVPLVQRAYERWEALERDSGRKLLVTTGGLMIGPRDGALVAGALESARQHQLRHEVLDATALRGRWPSLRPDADTLAVWEPRAGVLFPEECIAAHLEAATRAGAALRFDEPVESWAPDGDGVVVHTARGAYAADRLVLAAGAWLGRLLVDLGVSLRVRRQLLFWFAPRDPAPFAPARFPVFIWEHEADRFFYGFPDFGDGMKVARHGEGEVTEADRVRRDIDPAEADDLQMRLARHVPDAAGPLRDAAVCLYTCTPDAHFIVDAHPQHPQVTIASICSGHGFKFASVMGEILADHASGRPPAFDLSMFRLDRFVARR
jgi:sarcosine oxidase